MTRKSTEPTATPAADTIPETFKDGFPLPKLIAFDLDYTLWPFWVDTHVTPPLKPKDNNSRVVDRYGETFQFYRDVSNILQACRSKNILIAAASRTSAPDLARNLLNLLHLPPTNQRAIEYFDYLQIYPGSKTTHFSRIQKQTSLDYKEILFFDDESRNRNVEQLGVIMYLVRDGVTKEEIDRGVRDWRKRNGRETKEI